jgi:para-aminobenzoate synthetase component 1
MNRTPNSIIDRVVRQFDGKELILLESQHPDHHSSNISYIAAGPVSTISGYGEKIRVKDRNGIRQFKSNPWDALIDFQKEKKSWLIGYLGYDLKNYTEKLTSSNEPLNRAPDFYFMEPEVLLRIENGEITVLLGDPNLDLIDQREEKPGWVEEFGPAISKDLYLEKVSAIKERITEGDFYELNFSYPMQGAYYGDPYWLYKRMREVNPVPFGSFIRLNDLAVCCASPERFLKKEGARVISEPIKGTSPRSKLPAEDIEQREILLNEKNRAENLMIVDLVRHDLSRVSITGSVRVTKLFDIQTFGTVHQLISTVEAEAAPDLSSIEIIKACFPMGSMTGAPKINVMRVIEELEEYKRGIYSGAIGYITPDNDFDFNVVIRSAVIQNGKLTYPVGGAITSDSIPLEEWEETRVKCRAITGVIENMGPQRNEVETK